MWKSYYSLILTVWKPRKGKITNAMRRSVFAKRLEVHSVVEERWTGRAYGFQGGIMFFGCYNGGKRYIKHLSKPIEGRTPRVNLSVSNGACRLLSFNKRTTLVWNVNDGGGCTCWGKAQRVHENCIFCSVLLWTYNGSKKTAIKNNLCLPFYFSP